jgi:hypothetical protein
MKQDDCQIEIYFSELYELLSQPELSSVAKVTKTEIEDVRQDAKLLCWLIATGQSKHDPAKGGVRQYVMGHLWRDADRAIWHGHERIDQEDYTSAADLMIDEMADPLKILIERETDPYARTGLLGRIGSKLKYEEFLFLTGADMREIEEVTGISKSTAHRKITKRYGLRDRPHIGDVSKKTSNPTKTKPALESGF